MVAILDTLLLSSGLRMAGAEEAGDGADRVHSHRGQPESALPYPDVQTRDACGGLPENPHLSNCLAEDPEDGLQ